MQGLVWGEERLREAIGHVAGTRDGSSPAVRWLLPVNGYCGCIDLSTRAR